MKYISIIMILSFSYYCVGCYSRTVLNNEEEFRDILKKDGHIYVETRNGITYYYEAKAYKFKDDTLYGEGQKIIGLDIMKKPEHVKTACSDIEQIEIKQLDITITVVGVLFLGGILYWHLFWAQLQSP